MCNISPNTRTSSECLRWHAHDIRSAPLRSAPRCCTPLTHTRTHTAPDNESAVVGMISAIVGRLLRAVAVTQTNDAQVCEPCGAHLHTRSSPHVMTRLPHQGRPASEITEALARIVDMVPERTLLAFAVSPAGLRRLHSLVRYRSPPHLFPKLP